MHTQDTGCGEGSYPFSEVQLAYFTATGDTVASASHIQDGLKEIPYFKIYHLFLVRITVKILTIRILK